MTDSAVHPFQRSPARAHSGATYAGRVRHTPTIGSAIATLNLAPSNDQGQDRGTESAGDGAVYLDRLLVRKARRMLLVRTADIELIEAAGNYVRINTADAQHLLRTPLTELAASLDPKHFLRIHRSAIVNTDFLESVETNPAGDYFVRLPNGRRLKCSRTYRGDLRLFLQGFGS